MTLKTKAQSGQACLEGVQRGIKINGSQLSTDKSSELSLKERNDVVTGGRRIKGGFLRFCFLFFFLEESTSEF